MRIWHTQRKENEMKNKKSIAAGSTKGLGDTNHRHSERSHHGALRIPLVRDQVRKRLGLNHEVLLGRGLQLPSIQQHLETPCGSSRSSSIRGAITTAGYEYHQDNWEVCQVLFFARKILL